MKNLDSHAAGLKLAAMAAKSLALLPVICLICSIYSGTNSLSMLAAYLLALPVMALGYLIYYYDPLFHGEKHTWLGKSLLVLVVCGGLIWADFALIYGALSDLSGAVCCLAMLPVLFVWGYRAGDGSYSHVLTNSWHIGILIAYGAYVVITGVMWISSQRTMEINHDPVVLGAVIYGVLSMVVTNQASVDYELQNQDAESVDARRQIQRFNLRLSLIPAVLVLIGYFFRGPISSFFVSLFVLLRDGVMWLVDSLGGPSITFDTSSDRQDIPLGDQQGQLDQGGALGSQIEGWIPAALVLAVIALLFLFRKPILEALRKTVRFFSGFWQRSQGKKRSAATQYYQDLVEELDQETVQQLFGQEKKADPLRRQMKDYAKETQPDRKVRRALPLLRRLSRPNPDFLPGDTAREMTARMKGDAAALSHYADLYDKVRYGEQPVTQQEGEEAAALVRSVYSSK